MTLPEADYASYLSSIHPSTTWSLTPLTGGLVNTTLRASLTSGHAPHSTLILKHARPYIQVAGPEWKFSTKRQDVEATVLRMWDEGGLLHDLQTPSWRTPRCIRHDKGTEASLHLSPSDQDASILLLEDLGPLVHIVDFLKARSTPSHAPSDTQALASRLGHTIGTAMATIHSPSTLQRITSSPEDLATLSQSLAGGVIRSAALKPIRERLAGQEDAQRLFARVEGDWGEAAGYAYTKCLSNGDFMPGAVLIPQASHSEDATPIIVDWEFASAKGRGVNGDMAQFLATMHCELILAASQDNTTLEAALSNFTASLCASYSATAGLKCHCNAEDMGAQLLRSAFILTGREMINQAFDVYRAPGEETAKEMVRVGAWYLRVAGDDVREFVEEENWEEVKKEDRGLIQSLFVME